MLKTWLQVTLGLCIPQNKEVENEEMFMGWEVERRKKDATCQVLQLTLHLLTAPAESMDDLQRIECQDMRCPVNPKNLLSLIINSET